MKLTSVTREQISSHVPLPYYIPPNFRKNDFLKNPERTYTSEDVVGCLNHYEDKCLSAIHSLCIYRRIQGNPIKAIFFEPVLAGCGAILSRRCYKILASLAKAHGFKFIVDEVMTFGRLGYSSGFYSIEHFPKEMHQYVSMITIGKWMGAALLLQRVGDEMFDLEDDGRQPSTKINLSQMSLVINSVCEKFAHIQETRQMVLNHLGVNDHDVTWGDGLLIFLPGYLNNYEGPTNGMK